MKLKNKHVFRLFVTLCMVLSIFYPSVFSSIHAAETNSNTNGQFKLTATPNQDTNCIDLEWTAPNSSKDYTYMVYREDISRETQDGDEVYQSIPIQEDTVKVLQVYPSTYNNLELWVDEYGTYGGTTITCDSVSKSVFNLNPDMVYDYDVVVFGFGNWNGRYYNPEKGSISDCTEEATSTIEQYINDGYGVLFGHDVLACNIDSNFDELASYFNVELTKTDSYESVGCLGNSVTIAKKGSITEYPYSIGDTGTSLSVPTTHTAGQKTLGDVWMTINPSGDGASNLDYNTYLSTWNNCAMIQTGNRTGESSEDECKVLMNTLCYLNQRTDKTSCSEQMGDDLVAPDMPSLDSVKCVTTDDYNTLQIQTSASDNGSDCKYYVKAIDSSNQETVTSNYATANFKSDIKGYSILIDQNSDTDPGDTINSYNGAYQVALPDSIDTDKDIYIHIKAIDNAGNASETLHAVYQYEAPLTVSFDTNGAYTSVESQSISSGSTATVPDEPLKNGYQFVGWYSDSDCTEAYDFSTPVTTDITLYSKWVSTPILSISGGAIIAMQDHNIIDIQSYAQGVATNAADYEELYTNAEIKGTATDGKVVLDSSGLFTFNIVDEYQNQYYLLANYNVLTNSLLTFNDLLDEIIKAQYLYDSTPDDTANLKKGDAYTTSAAKKTLLNAIAEAKTQFYTATDQSTINTSIATLQKAELVFQDSILFFKRSFLTVIGDTIHAKPLADNYSIRVAYNVDSNKQLAPKICDNWTNFLDSPYKITTTDFVWTDVPDGIYTMVIYHKNLETGTEKAYFELAIVANNTEPSTLAKDFLSTIYDEAQSLLKTTKEESDAEVGDTYVSTVTYNDLADYVEKCRIALNNDSISYDLLTARIFTLEHKINAFKKEMKTLEKEYEEATDSLSITVNDATATISRSNLYSVSIAKGTYDSDDAFKNASSTTYSATNGSVDVTLQEAGTYTVLAKYNDSTTEYAQFEITTVPSPSEEPEKLSITLSESDGIIHVTNNSDSEIAYTKYAYGDYQDEDDTLTYIETSGFTEDIQAIGKGIHTVYVKDTSGNECYATIDVTSVTEPSVQITDSKLTTYTYGFDIISAAYTKGTYSNLDDFNKNSITYIPTNLFYANLSTFESGDYTFYFEASDNTTYFIHVTI